jgi:hypothetical protein
MTTPVAWRSSARSRSLNHLFTLSTFLSDALRLVKSVPGMLLCESRQFMFLQMVSLVMGDSRGEVSMRREFVKFSGFSM